MHLNCKWNPGRLGSFLWLFRVRSCFEWPQTRLQAASPPSIVTVRKTAKRFACHQSGQHSFWRQSPVYSVCLSAEWLAIKIQTSSPFWYAYLSFGSSELFRVSYFPDGWDHSSCNTRVCRPVAPSPSSGCFRCISKKICNRLRLHFSFSACYSILYCISGLR